MSLVPSSVTGTISDVIPTLVAVPPVDYTSRDYASLVSDTINLIPSYLPEWTDRSPGDMGIVLIELFAYVGDILNFYSDRIANEAYLATAQQRQSVLNIASMLDYTPYGNVAATVSLHFTIADPSVTPILIPGPGDPGGPTVVSTNANGSQPVTFQTTQSLWIYGDQAGGTASASGTGLAYQQVLLGNDPGVAWPTYVFHGASNQTVTVNGGAAWVYVPSFSGQAWNAKVYTIINGTTVQFGTGIGGVGNGLAPSAGDQILVTYQPAAPGQYAGDVLAIQAAQVVGESVGISTGAPNQRFTLFSTPVVDGSVSIWIDQGGAHQLWHYFQRMVDAGPNDPAYSLSTDSNGVVSIIFGDGINGSVPISGAMITANYNVGGGSKGNVAAKTLTNIGIAIPGVLSVTNPAGAYGGADAETLDHIRIHAPLSVTAINRAVTLDDYAALLLNIPSIAKAAAAATYFNTVNLYIHPAGDFFPNTTAGLQALQTAINTLKPSITNSNQTGYLDDKKMVTTSIQVLGPQYNKAGTLSLGYVPVNVTLTVQVLAQYHQNTVKAAVQAAIQNLFLFSVVDFGSYISLSSVYHTVQAVEGVDYVNVSVLCRNEQTPQVAADVQCGPYEIPQANAVTINASGGIIY